MFFVHSLFQVYAVALQQTTQTIKEPKTTRKRKQQKPKEKINNSKSHLAKSKNIC